MSIDTVCYITACLGTLFTIVGRYMLMIEAVSFSTGWAWAIRLLPLADVMFLARFWDTAKAGAFTSITGLALLMPLGAKKMWDQKHIGPKEYAERGHAVSIDNKSAIYLQFKVELDARIVSRQRKLEKMNAHLSAWYTNMTARRNSLGDATPEQFTAFNHEAEAYQSLRQITKEEAAELQEMINKQAKGFSAYTDEDFGRFVIAGENAGAKTKGRRGRGKTVREDATPEQLIE